MTRNNIMWQHFTVVQRNSVTHCMQFDKENAEGSLNVTGPASSSATGTKLRDHCLGWRLCVCLLECVHPHVTSTPSVTPLVPCLSPLVSQTLAPSLHTLAFFLPLFPSRYLVCVIVYGSLSHPGSSPIWPQSLLQWCMTSVSFSSSQFWRVVPPRLKAKVFTPAPDCFLDLSLRTLSVFESF